MADFKTFRKLNNLTQQQAAEYFGCLQSFISQIETGRCAVPESFISKILAEGVYQLPANMSRETDVKPNIESEPIKEVPKKASPDKEKYITALESLISYKDKEIEDLRAMIKQLQSDLAELQRAKR